MTMKNKIKVLRREDGREFTYSPELDGLVRKGQLRLIEKTFDDGKYVDEVDLTKVDDDNNEDVLRLAISRKWPHLTALIDRPDLARMAVRMASAKAEPADGQPSKILALAGVTAGGTELVPDELPPESAPADAAPGELPEDKAKPAKAKAKPATAPETVDPNAQAISDFADLMRKAPGREAKQAVAKEHGIEIELATAGSMVAEAVAEFKARLTADKPKA
jgi:hypothetical protein